MPEDIKLAYVTLQYVSDAPPLGLASMATYLKQYGKFNNQKIIDVPDKDRLKAILDYSPDIIFISVNTMHYPQAVQFSKEIKEKLKIPIIIGGVHISTFPNSLDSIFNVGVIGEGEQTALNLMNIFREHRSLNDDRIWHVNGLVYFHQKKIKKTPTRDLIKPLDKIPFPDRSYLDKRYFTKKTIIHTKTAKRLTGITTSRGCPYSCIFCSTSNFWREFRMNSAKHIADEIEYLIDEYQIQAFFVYDDIFTIHKDRLKELVEILKKRHLLGKFSLNCMGRTDTIDEEVLELLKQLNTDYINFGFESGSDKVLQFMKNSKISVEDHKKAIRLCNRYGIGVQGSLMFGSPTETVEDLKKTLELIDFMYDNGVGLVWSTITKPLPGTPMWKYAIDKKIISPDIDLRRLSEMNIDPIMKEPSVSLEEFNKLFFEGRRKIRKMELRFWIKKLLRSPFSVALFVLSNFKFIKFFTSARGEP